MIQKALPDARQVVLNFYPYLRNVVGRTDTGEKQYMRGADGSCGQYRFGRGYDPPSLTTDDIINSQNTTALNH